MNALGSGIANWCKENGAVSEDDYPIILYGIQVFLNSALKLAGVLLAGLLLHRFWAVLISLVVFCSMRYWTGGWHSNSHLGCFCAMLAVCLAPSFFMGLNGGWAEWLLRSVMLYSVYRVFRYAPCNSKVNPIEDPKCLRKKRIGGMVEITGLFIGMLVCPDMDVRWLVVLPTFANAVMLTF